MSVLLVFALEQESQHLFDAYDPVYCGVGKINAAYALARALVRYQAEYGAPPDLVLNLGSAGSTQFKRGTIVNCTQFVQRDMDVTALRSQPYATPFDAPPTILANGMRYAELPEGVCGTGDSFVTTAGAAVPWNVIDMEAYALAKVCLLEGVAYGCMKYITDGADGHAPNAWQDTLQHTAQALHELFIRLRL